MPGLPFKGFLLSSQGSMRGKHGAVGDVVNRPLMVNLDYNPCF